MGCKDRSPNPPASSDPVSPQPGALEPSRSRLGTVRGSEVAGLLGSPVGRFLLSRFGSPAGPTPPGAGLGNRPEE